MPRFLILALCGSLLAAGCLRRSGSGEAAVQEQAAGENQAARPEIPREQDTDSAVRREAPPGRSPQAVQGSPELRVYTNRDDPFFGLPARQNPPFDFTLGLLYDESSADAHSRAVYEIFSGFFQTLNEGKDAADFLHPDYRPFLLRNLEYAARSRAEDAPENSSDGETPQSTPVLKSAIQDVRIGGLSFSENREMAQAQVLLFGARGRALGQLVAEQKDEQWYISGITVAFEDLFLLGEQKSAEAFDPGPGFDTTENLW
jgi:hypothetical protein